MASVLHVEGLRKTYGRATVIEDVSFAIEPGQRLAVLGPSGSGKTTLLRLIAGLEPPTAGEITIAGRPASRSGEVLVPPQHREVALVFQGLALFPQLRALDQIAFAARGRGGKKRADELLDQIGLGPRASARLDELSGGERQRIALARALAQEPKLILMDEPFASLDDDKRSEMRDLLRSLLEQTNATLVLVTHSRDDAFDLASRVLVLERGRMAAHESLEVVVASPRHVAAVRALGLGQIVEGEITAAGTAMTAFGVVRTTAAALSGPVLLLVRPDQPRLVANGTGAEGEVASLEMRQPEARTIRRVAVVRVRGQLLRVLLTDQTLAVGQHVNVQIAGDCDPLEAGLGGRSP